MQKNFQNDKGSGFWQTRDFLDMWINSVAITEYSIASDEDGNVLKRQVTDYMADYPIGGLLEKITGNIGELNNYQLDTKDVAGERAVYEARIAEIELPKQEIEEGVFEEIPLNNPADIANSTRSIGVLNLVGDDISSISTVRV